MPTREPVQKIQGFGTRLLNRLRSLEMSQTALAEKAKVSRQTLHRAIHRDELTGRVAKQIADVVGPDLLAMTAEAPPVTVPWPATHAPRGGARLVVAEDGAAAAPLQVDGGSSLSPAGEVLEIMRLDLDISQDEMAAAARISLSTYRRIIGGETTPKETWLRKWGEFVDLHAPDAMLQLLDFTGPTTPFYRAVGRQLHAWRVSNGNDLVDVADALGIEAVRIAMYEAGLTDSILALDELAPLYGTSAEVILRAAQLVAPEDDDHWRPPVERVLTFEAAQASAREQQREREEYRETGTWHEEEAFELGFVRARVGFSVKEVAELLGTKKKIVAAWEEGDREPTPEEFERLAILYRTTPWHLRYGSAWSRAIAFPNAQESRAHIFAAILPREARAWLYRFLGLLAEYGLDDTALDSVRESLTVPDHYYDVQFVRTEAEAVLFLRAKLRARGEEMWRNLTTPGWVDSADDTAEALPTLLAQPGFDIEAGNTVMADLRQRAREVSYRRDLSALGLPRTSPDDGPNKSDMPPALPDPFSYYRTHVRRPLLLTDPPREPYRARPEGRPLDDETVDGQQPESQPD